MSSALQTVRSDLPQANSAQMRAASSGVLIPSEIAHYSEINSPSIPI
jgi:hypothetical protein